MKKNIKIILIIISIIFITTSFYQINPTTAFTTYNIDNNPPNTPSNPTPANDSIEIQLNSNLSWIGGDPDGDIVNYDIYFSINNSSLDDLISNNQSNTTYNPINFLDYNSTYYWQIVATDEHGASNSSPIWNFKTKYNTNNTTNNSNNTILSDNTIYYMLIIGMFIVIILLVAIAVVKKGKKE